jgi:hypothetical protein
MMKLRVLERSFVNVKGGKGNNVESDLFQKHAVKTFHLYVQDVKFHWILGVYNDIQLRINPKFHSKF